MADITTVIDQVFKQHDAHLSHSRRTRSDTRDKFLKEAYRINSHVFALRSYLHAIRQPYLSTSLRPHRQRHTSSHATSSRANGVSHSHEQNKSRNYFTDTQRDQIDAESKATLRDLNAAIRQLEEAEQLRQNTELKLANNHKARNTFHSLSRWAAGGGIGESPKSPEERIEECRQETLKVHRESVLWYLRKKLEEAAQTQSLMMQTRLDREIEKSKSALYKTKGAGGAETSLEHTDDKDFRDLHGGGGRRFGTGKTTTSEIDNPNIEQSLTPEQLQLFAQENSEMLKHYEDTLDKIRTAERSMLEISELQTTLAQNLEVQSIQIDQLVSQGLETQEDVAGGNKQLTRAAERKGPARIVFQATCGFCLFLILWDFFI